MAAGGAGAGAHAANASFVDIVGGIICELAADPLSLGVLLALSRQ